MDRAAKLPGGTLPSPGVREMVNPGPVPCRMAAGQAGGRTSRVVWLWVCYRGFLSGRWDVETGIRWLPAWISRLDVIPGSRP